MAGIDLLPFIAIMISLVVALSQLSKEYRERKALKAKEKQSHQQAEESQALLPIRGANEAVIALRGALDAAREDETKMRARITILERDNETKDQMIDQLEKRIWYCERELKTLKGEDK